MSTNRASGQAATATASQKAWTFDVASIKKQTAGGQPMMVMPKFGPTADGYRSSKLPLSLVLITAYVPQTGGAASYGQSQIAGLPDWMKTQPYDADARIAADDRAEWQKPDKQPEMLRPMLQALLAERLNLQVHREFKESALYTLVVGKGGPKFEETKPDVAHPGGIELPGGGTVIPNFKDGKMTMRFFGTSMGMLTSYLSGMVGRSVEDQTGLTGRYDLTMANPMAMMRGPSVQTGLEDSGPSVFSEVESLGLKLVPGKGPVETLVVDHVEKPSAN